MPIIPEILALKIAPGKLPLAIDTITTEDETVEGNAAINKKASHKISYEVFFTNGKNGKISIGNSKNVDA